LLFAGACKKTEHVSSDPVLYFPSVKKIIGNNCFSCHLSSGTWSGRPTKFDTEIDITTLHEAIKRSVADPVTITNKRMPQGGSLSAGDIDIIVKWHAKGGKSTD
jgi:uncharacterized membrane protein